MKPSELRLLTEQAKQKAIENQHQKTEKTEQTNR